jgi:WD40 repeat protein
VRLLPRGGLLAPWLVPLLACGGADGPRPEACATVACLERELVSHGARVTSLAFSPDGRRLASGSTDFTARIWDPLTGASLRTLAGHSSSVLCVAFSPDGRLLATGSEDATVRLWRPEDGQLVAVLVGAAAGVSGLAFTQQGGLLLASSNDHRVHAWELASGQEVLSFTAHPAPVTALALAPDGRSFATSGGTPDGRVVLWSFPAVTQLWQGLGETGVWSLAFAPNGLRLAAGGTFGTVRVRWAADGSQLAVLQAGDWSVQALAYSGDGQYLAASARDAVHVFDASSGASRGLLTGHAGLVFALAFSPDSRRLASGSDDQTVRLWAF